ncbi:MAG: trypsin-like peptidase domain-containing protein, partial [Oscillochloris sp.]|nr:trypsin-like peptidase domain-containing protein [Oscillochloris sp.]
MSTSPSIVLIQSREAGNSAIGTGFIIHQAGEHSYILTCAHVVRDVGGATQVLADARPAEVVALGEDNALDLAVLRVAPLEGRAALVLRSGGTFGQAVRIEGYFKHASYHRLEPIEGQITRSFTLSDTGKRHFVTAWNIIIDAQQKLRSGYSGAPVCDAASGAVLGVMFTSEGQQQGQAITLEALRHIWPTMPEGLVAAGSAADTPLPPQPAMAPTTAPAQATPGALINLGSGNTIGEIRIGDIAGRDILKGVITEGGPPQPVYRSVYLAAHPGLKGTSHPRPGEYELDWSRDFLNGDPPPDLWERALVPDLQRLQDTCRAEGKRLIKLRAFARNTAALAFGHIFNQRAGFHIHYSDNRDVLWRSDEPTRVPSPLVRTDTALSPTGRDLVLELAVTQYARNVSQPVDAWLGEPSARAAPASSAGPIDRVKLRQALINLFSDGELRDLCFDLGIDYENLPGQAKGDKARELIGYAERTSRSAELVAVCRALRPQGDWGGAPSQATTHAASVGQRIMLAREDQTDDLSPAEGAAIARQVCDLIGR